MRILQRQIVNQVSLSETGFRQLSPLVQDASIGTTEMPVGFDESIIGFQKASIKMAFKVPLGTRWSQDISAASTISIVVPSQFWSIDANGNFRNWGFDPALGSTYGTINLTPGVDGGWYTINEIDMTQLSYFDEDGNLQPDASRLLLLSGNFRFGVQFDPASPDNVLGAGVTTGDIYNLSAYTSFILTAVPVYRT